MAKHFTLPYEGGLITENLPAGILHTYEKIWTHVYPESRPASYVIDFYRNRKRASIPVEDIEKNGYRIEEGYMPPYDYLPCLEEAFLK